MSNNGGDGYPIAYERDFTLSVGPQSTSTVCVIVPYQLLSDLEAVHTNSDSTGNDGSGSKHNYYHNKRPANYTTTGNRHQPFCNHNPHHDRYATTRYYDLHEIHSYRQAHILYPFH